MQRCLGESQLLGHLLLHCRSAGIKTGVRVKTDDRIVQSIQMTLTGLKELKHTWGPSTVKNRQPREFAS